ncbi:zinc-binding alcohol dehydrogenase family protein [Aspergillus novofumigatus IBT 16806]|uniref:GroES-like protein n=1 Tax=Aspergillus novofumigatus (strain IBT 16806) TaxID=1392255 RepID=A0A2I1BTZ1_ASPN1|nr:GroES-like protein [Aspergillus novofumigatus IBT 16806]PKX88873.1 GroES-like protein [Aspergillus novofumigatus IBT 16806]
MAENEAAWITAPAENPFRVESAPKPKPGPGKVVIRNSAVAINPVHWKVHLGRYLNTYPFILGQDAGGVVEDVGSGVTRFKKGQWVIAHYNGLMTQSPANGAFQLYPATDEALVAEIPDSLAFEQAAVLPLAVSPASADNVKNTGQVLLVWGGASSVDATAIQLAVASGLTLFATASEANREFLKSLGADTIFDYRSPTVVEDITDALKGTTLAGVYGAVSEGPSSPSFPRFLTELTQPIQNNTLNRHPYTVVTAIL